MKVANVLIATAGFVAAGCASPPVNPDVRLNVPTGWVSRSATAAAGRHDLATWWKGFQDPALDRLIAEALVANRDLAIARARARAALAAAVAGESVLYPRIDAEASIGRGKDLTRTAHIVDDRKALLTSSWEIDLLGGNALDAQATRARARGAREALHSVRVVVVAEVARNYFELRTLRARMDIVRRSIGVQRETLRLVEGRFRTGLVTNLDVARAEAQLESTKALVPGLDTEAAARAHRLSALLGRVPGAFEDLPPLSDAAADSAPELPDLLPGDLLGQRPDLRQAREDVVTRAALLGSAKTDLFPRFSLAAGVGRQAARVEPNPFQSGNVFSLGALLAAPLFNAGRIRAGIEAADARLSEAAARYEKAFLESLEDVENSYVVHRDTKLRHRHLAKSYAAADQAAKRALALYRSGATDYSVVLDSQRTALLTEDALLRSANEYLLSIVGLYRAFGGGWKTAGSSAHNRPVRN